MARALWLIAIIISVAGGAVWMQTQAGASHGVSNLMQWPDPRTPDRSLAINLCPAQKVHPSATYTDGFNDSAVFEIPGEAKSHILADTAYGQFGYFIYDDATGMINEVSYMTDLQQQWMTYRLNAMDIVYAPSKGVAYALITSRTPANAFSSVDLVEINPSETLGTSPSARTIVKLQPLPGASIGTRALRRGYWDDASQKAVFFLMNHEGFSMGNPIVFKRVTTFDPSTQAFEILESTTKDSDVFPAASYPPAPDFMYRQKWSACFRGSPAKPPAPPKPVVCGDKVCNYPTETRSSCSRDCSICGDGMCDDTGTENKYNCTADCVPVCGNHYCEPAKGETSALCPQDCPLPVTSTPVPPPVEPPVIPTDPVPPPVSPAVDGSALMCSWQDDAAGAIWVIHGDEVRITGAESRGNDSMWFSVSIDGSGPVPYRGNMRNLRIEVPTASALSMDRSVREALEERGVEIEIVEGE